MVRKIVSSFNEILPFTSGALRYIRNSEGDLLDTHCSFQPSPAIRVLWGLKEINVLDSVPFRLRIQF